MLPAFACTQIGAYVQLWLESVLPPMSPERLMNSSFGPALEVRPTGRHDPKQALPIVFGHIRRSIQKPTGPANGQPDGCIVWGLYKSCPLGQLLNQDLDQVFKNRQELLETHPFAE